MHISLLGKELQIEIIAGKYIISFKGRYGKLYSRYPKNVDRRRSGIRTTVFFKGCNLKCRWCHNPESLSFKQQKYWIEDNCIGCFSCEKVCPEQAISFTEIGMKVNASLCTYCLRCADECPTNSIEVKGEKIEVAELYQELLKDISYYENSAGGVTLSGGEAVLHNDYVFELLKKLKLAKIHTAVDTAGHYPFEMLERLIPYTDLILLILRSLMMKPTKSLPVSAINGLRKMRLNSVK